MNTPKVSPLYHALALFGDALTANQFAYKNETPTGDATRFLAGARIASIKGGVIPYEEYGYYSVMSDDPKRPVPYQVCALPGELFCPCSDGTHSKHNKSGLCKHLFAALMVAAIQEV
jgi:hypothetical protein